MTPAWIFPAYPMLLTAPLAGALIASADMAGHSLSIDALAVALCAATTQGTGCLIAFMISAAFIYRLMTQKLPRDMQRPGVVCISNPRFLCGANGSVHVHWSVWLHRCRNRYGHSYLHIFDYPWLTRVAQLGGLAHRIVPPGFLDSDIPADIIKVVSVLVGLWLWGLAIWFFLVSVGSLWKYVRAGHNMPFQMTWWSFVFPNTALVRRLISSLDGHLTRGR